MEKLRFAFGQNWQEFLKQLDDKAIEKALNSLVKFLGTEGVKNKTFIDIGCGSGLFSYSAYLLGASRIVSFDYDINSVNATKILWEKAGKPENWKIEQGSALDNEYLKNLGKFDIVYSWGVLHHTGNMYQAIENTAKMVSPNGTYYIALYNKIEGRFGTSLWYKIKKKYNSGGILTKKLIEWVYIFIYYILAPLMSFKNPFKFMKEYGAARGMNWRRDVTDWVGGYPYEDSSPGEIFTFVTEKFPNFKLVKMKTTSSIGCNTFVFAVK